MTYILSAQRTSADATKDRFRAYFAYLESVQDRLPAGTFALAKSPWYYDPGDHRCPHDAWLESATIQEAGTGARHEHRAASLRVVLLGAHHDGHIQYDYIDLQRYELHGPALATGHGDWLYDEFRLRSDGQILHEVEWASGAHWLIECQDVRYQWMPGAQVRKGLPNAAT